MNRQPPGYGPGHLPFDKISRDWKCQIRTAPQDPKSRMLPVQNMLRMFYPASQYCCTFVQRILTAIGLSVSLRSTDNFYTTFPLATMKGIEPLPPERQSGTLTITPHSHFASKKNRSHEPKNKTNLALFTHLYESI